MKILISPYSVKAKEGINPKDYPHWQAVIVGLKERGHKVIQIGVAGEDPFIGAEQKFDKSMDELDGLLKLSDLWMSVDNFFPHFVNLKRLRSPKIKMVATPQQEENFYKEAWEEYSRKAPGGRIDEIALLIKSPYQKPGIVIWGPSDPSIFGYKYNSNLLKSPKFLRPDQYQTWNQWEFNADAFVSSDFVLSECDKLLQ